MAIHVVFAKLNRGVELDRIPLASQTVAVDTASDPAPANTTHVDITAIDADQYVSVSKDTPDASVDPRWFLKAGQSKTFAASVGDKVIAHAYP